MTVHARQFARQCRERMATRDDKESRVERQPEQQQQAASERSEDKQLRSRGST